MSEQFTDEEIELAKELKSFKEESIYQVNESEVTCQNKDSELSYYAKPKDLFKYLDTPIALEDIINSRSNKE